jgi:hypothetical protein
MLDCYTWRLASTPFWLRVLLFARLLEQELTAVHLLIRIPVLPHALWVFFFLDHILRRDRKRYRLVWFCRELRVSALRSGSLKSTGALAVRIA